MRKQITLFLTVIIVGLGLVACQSAPEPMADKAPVETKEMAVEKTEAPAEATPAMEAKVISVDELDAMLAAKEVTVCDANGEKTRAEFGIIPGAMLVSADTFDAKVLPEQKDANIVFYCSSEKCAAAPKTAQKAVEAGYKNVGVLKVGIKGWKAAGKTTEMPEEG